jgi:hypothetical protein
MKHLLCVLAVAGIGVFLAGHSLSGVEGRSALPSGASAGTEGLILVPLLDDGTLPEGHPPLTRRQSGLPPGHPPLPEWHPPLPEANAVCPRGQFGQDATPGDGPGPSVPAPSIIST